MALFSSSSGATVAQLNDQPLNYGRDQAANLDPQLRSLNLRLARRTAADIVSDPAAALFLAGTAALFFRRRLAAATFFVAGVMVERALSRRPTTRSHSEQELKRLKEIGFQRHALKAQRGDYGKMQVIPFR